MAHADTNAVEAVITVKLDRIIRALVIPTSDLGFVDLRLRSRFAKCSDDLAAIIIIAVFYTSQLSILALVGAALCLSVLFVFNRVGV